MRNNTLRAIVVIGTISLVALTILTGVYLRHMGGLNSTEFLELLRIVTTTFGPVVGLLLGLTFKGD